MYKVEMRGPLFNTAKMFSSLLPPDMLDDADAGDEFDEDSDNDDLPDDMDDDSDEE